MDRVFLHEAGEVLWQHIAELDATRRIEDVMHDGWCYHFVKCFQEGGKDKEKDVVIRAHRSRCRGHIQEDAWLHLVGTTLRLDRFAHRDTRPKRPKG